jgi:calcineurin-like phosphoesterase family protein
MPATFLVSDTHFGHTGVCRFTREDGVTKLRPWDDPDEMDEEAKAALTDEAALAGFAPSLKARCST